MIPQPPRARASREAPAAAAQLELTATARGRYRAKAGKNARRRRDFIIMARDVTMLKRRQSVASIGRSIASRAAAILSSLALGTTVSFVARGAPEPADATAAAAPAAEAAGSGPLQEIIVTATRHEENLSKVPLSITALNQDAMDVRGIKDILDVARFTPGMNIDNSGTNNIAIRGIASTGGAGTTGIYLDDTPIQMRALAFNPDEALPQSFDLERVEVLRGPQGTLFGAGSEGGTVRYITAQPSLTETSVYSRDEVSYTQGGSPNYEAGIAGGTPVIDGKLGIRVTAWYRDDGGYIDRIDPVTLDTLQKNANYTQTKLFRFAAIWAPADNWKVTPSYYYQDRYANDVQNYWPLYSNPSRDQYVDANPTQRTVPDTYYIPALKIEGDLGAVTFISNSSYFHRKEETGYDGTLYNLGFYQTQPTQAETNEGASAVFPTPFSCQPPAAPNCFPLLDGTGLHLPPGATNYRAPASVDNGQENLTQELRLQSNDPNAALIWTTGFFFSTNRQTYLEQIHDPLLNELTEAVLGEPYTDVFCYENAAGACVPVPYDPRFPNDSYFLQTFSRDQQYALFGEGTYSFTDQLKTTVGLRYSRTEFSFNTLTGGPQLFLSPQTGTGDKKETAFTPKISLQYQYDPHDLYYFTYAKGFRPGGANNPVPYAACGTDFRNFGISGSPATFNSDTVDSFEVGAKNNLDNRVKIASSIYYIRWNNIQQVVVPPICQISFITNLGQAVAKGADIQADVAMTESLTAEISAGYTEARYTETTRLSPTEQTPIVEKGDSIVGQSSQPPPPFTLSVGVEYKFSLVDHESFVRVDDEYEARSKWPWAGQDPNTLQYDSANYTLSSNNFASARGGTRFGPLEVEAFCDNLFDSHPVTNYEWSIDPQVANTSRLERDFTFRPRTFGLTFIYRSK
jgi:iron complex outermembrane receptor protein